MRSKAFALKSALLNLSLVIFSIAFCFAGLELFLRAAELTASPSVSQPAVPSGNKPTQQITAVPDGLVAAAEARYRLLTMPEEWKRTPVNVPGAMIAYNWQGVLHVYNSDEMRRVEPFPPKQRDVYRVMVVGDSLTYGYGIAPSATFVEQLNKQMGPDFKIEFLNLGVSGSQSEDILKRIRRFLPELKPNLVIYAICLNDFLPSGVGEYHFSYAVPIPKDVKDFLLKHTRSAAYLSDLYDGALRRLHIRQNFFDDILGNFAGYQERFGRDLRDMNATIIAAGLPPLVAMVVDQYPSNLPGQKIAAVAEEHVLKSGATLIPTTDYYRSYADTRLHVSRWEGHPNEVAHYIWAQMIAENLKARPDLQPFARASKAAVGAGPNNQESKNSSPN